jgi:ATP-binding cassette subfamily C protein LapB
MDMGAESTLLQRLGKEIGDSTFVTITHKASLLQIVNKIIVIDQGRVAMQGTPDQLLRAQQPQQQAQ